MDPRPHEDRKQAIEMEIEACQILARHGLMHCEVVDVVLVHTT